MKKVLVIGAGGSGKSTLSRTLGQKLGLDVLHLDKYYWRAGWKEPPKDEWLQTVAELLKRESWIIDGNYSGTLEQRVAACDTIVFLDLARLVCVWRVVKRRLLYRHHNRPDMAEGCAERLNLEFFLWIMNYSQRTRPKVVRLIEANRKLKKIVWLKSRKDLDLFLREVGTNA
jgi:adenylate kinase family enzyme